MKKTTKLLISGIVFTILFFNVHLSFESSSSQNSSFSVKLQTQKIQAQEEEEDVLGGEDY